MKLTRQKKLQRYLSFFCNNYNFHQPYQVLIDGTFCFASLNNKSNIREQLPKYLNGDIKFLTTHCVILETERLGPKIYGAMVILKQFGIHKCGHEKLPVSGSECILSMLEENNPNRYLIATQDRDLQKKARNIPGTPILYLHQMTPTLEPPSKASQGKANTSNLNIFSVSKLEGKKIEETKKQFGIKDEEKKTKFKKKKIKQPNSLSCKTKKKNAPNSKSIQEGQINKRKRKRIKISKHLKEQILNNNE